MKKYVTSKESLSLGPVANTESADDRGWQTLSGDDCWRGQV